MVLELRWVISQSTNCLYVADMLRGGLIPADEQLAAAIGDFADLLQKEIELLGRPEEEVWEHLVPLSAGIENNRQLADSALRKALRTQQAAEDAVGRIAGRIADLEAAMRRAAPELVDALTLDVQPLRDAWEAQGENLLYHVARLTDERTTAAGADVLVVRPAFRGGGKPYLNYNSITIEVLPEDSAAELPEVVRLGWLLSQLNLDLPVFTEKIRRERRSMVAALAMVPVMLAAAEEAGLARHDSATVRAALENWRVAGAGQVDRADVLGRWWATYLESRPRWDVALAALEQMLGPTTVGGQ